MEDKEVCNQGEMLDNKDLVEDVKSCLMKASIDTLCSMLRKEFKKGFTNMKCASIPLEKRKEVLVKSILNECEKNEKDINLLVVEHLNKKKITSSDKNYEWINEFEVGEEIIVNVSKGRWTFKKVKAVVKKINKCGISVNCYNYDTITDYAALRNQTIGKTRLIWTDLQTKTKVIQSRHNIYKRGEFYDDMFNEGWVEVDYGY